MHHCFQTYGPTAHDEICQVMTPASVFPSQYAIAHMFTVIHFNKTTNAFLNLRFTYRTISMPLRNITFHTSTNGGPANKVGDGTRTWSLLNIFSGTWIFGILDPGLPFKKTQVAAVKLLHDNIRAAFPTMRGDAGPPSLGCKVNIQFSKYTHQFDIHSLQFTRIISDALFVNWTREQQACSNPSLITSI